MVREGLQGGTRVGLLSVFLHKKYIVTAFNDRLLLINSHMFAYLSYWF